MKILTITNKSLKEIPKHVFNSNVDELYCSSNKIECIENLPNTVKRFYCWDNQILFTILCRA